MRYWLGWLYLRSFGWKIEGPKPPFKKYLILAAPHTSNWDVPAMLAMSYVYGIRVSWIGKHSLFRGPLGPLMRFLIAARVTMPSSRWSTSSIVATSSA
jgi:1-acyl-sn-glycerol-3-phosphate acyltransferase